MRPGWLQGAAYLTPEAIAQLPLLQQSTRIEAWRQWFDAKGVVAPQAMKGARLELFSMTAAAALHGMGLALMPTLLVEDELARGHLLVACDQALGSKRAYYLVWPERSDNPSALQCFLNWLLQRVGSSATVDQEPTQATGQPCGCGSK